LLDKRAVAFISLPSPQYLDCHKPLRAVGERIVFPVAELCSSLIAQVQQFSATQEFNDNVCLVAMDIARLKPL
jgi:hypothetical protein